MYLPCPFDGRSSLKPSSRCRRTSKSRCRGRPLNKDDACCACRQSPVPRRRVAAANPDVFARNRRNFYRCYTAAKTCILSKYVSQKGIGDPITICHAPSLSETEPSGRASDESFAETEKPPMTSIRIYNTLAREKQPFVPLQAGTARMYVCGMTVYDYCHLGHARVMVVFDMVQRWLRHPA